MRHDEVQPGLLCEYFFQTLMERVIGEQKNVLTTFDFFHFIFLEHVIFAHDQDFVPCIISYQLCKVYLALCCFVDHLFEFKVFYCHLLVLSTSEANE